MKIQHVLGHFQKDFEGGVSAENLGKLKHSRNMAFLCSCGTLDFPYEIKIGCKPLTTGAKFGGYGSFLPSYQRSPVWSHSRTPPKGHNCSTSRSPNNFQQEVNLFSFVLF